MLSKKALRYLRFLSERTEYRSYMQLEKDYDKFDPQQFWAIYNAGFLDCYPLTDSPENEVEKWMFLIENVQFRINDAGYAYLDATSKKNLEVARGWIAIGISILALFVSIMALILELMSQQTVQG